MPVLLLNHDWHQEVDGQRFENTINLVLDLEMRLHDLQTVRTCCSLTCTKA